MLTDERSPAAAGHAIGAAVIKEEQPIQVSAPAGHEAHAMIQILGVELFQGEASGQDGRDGSKDAGASNQEGGALRSRPGDKPGKRSHSGPRVSLTLAQKIKAIEVFDSAEPKMSRAQLAEWVTAQFDLKQTPSKGFISMMLKDRHKLQELSTEVKLRSDGGNSALNRKRKRSVGNSAQQILEEKLLEWVQQRSAEPGTGRGVLSDQALIEQARAIAADNGLVFSPLNFNFSSKWLMGFKRANDIRRGRVHISGA